MKWAALALALAIASPTQAAELWQGSQSGDTRVQVLARFHDAVPNPEPDRLADGSRCEVHIPRFQIAAFPYEVCFFIKVDRLTQVTLTSRSGARGHQANLEFDAVIELLRNRYGREGRYQDRSDSVMTMIGADWYLDGRNISALLIYVGRDSEATININYQTRVADQSSVL